MCVAQIKLSHFVNTKLDDISGISGYLSCFDFSEEQLLKDFVKLRVKSWIRNCGIFHWQSHLFVMKAIFHFAQLHEDDFSLSKMHLSIGGFVHVNLIIPHWFHRFHQTFCHFTVMVKKWLISVSSRIKENLVRVRRRDSCHFTQEWPKLILMLLKPNDGIFLLSKLRRSSGQSITNYKMKIISSQKWLETVNI